MHYFNEIDPNAAAWIRQLIEDKQIPAGHVDERSIVEVTPSDLKGYVQCHWFAGISGWPLALKLARWPEDRPVWTASLPCQSFSSAGKQRGTADERHLWPVFERLVRECRPPVLFGEQVASKLARTDWLPGVCLDLQNLGYSATAFDICAPCAGEVGEGRIVRGDQEAWERIILGAPHIRQRLYWVACRMADTDSERHHGIDPLLRRDEPGRNSEDIPQAAGSSATSRMADTDGLGRSHEQQSQVVGTEPASERGVSGGMAQPRNDGAGSLTGQARHEGRKTVDTGAEGLRQDHGTACTGGADPRSAGCDADSRMDDSDNHEHDSHGRGDGETGGIPGVDRAAVCAGESGGTGSGEPWKRVSFAADCLGGDDDEPGDECSICGLTYAEDCECPGPTHDGYEYAERDGVLYARWVGDTGSEGSQGHAGNVGDGCEPGRQHQEQARPAWAASWADAATGDPRMADTLSERRRSGSAGIEDAADARTSGEAHRPEWTGFWAETGLVHCRDKKARRVPQQCIFPLAHGLPRGVVPSGDPGEQGYANATGEARVMRLKGYGNAICAPLAAMFISTCMEVIPE